MGLRSTDIFVNGRLLKTAGVKNVWIFDVENPESIIRELKERKVSADLFTFWQRYPDVTPRFPYHLEWDNWAVLSITSYEDWFKHQINRHARKAVRRSIKAGVQVKTVPLNDEFALGVMKIFNETPFRQGKKFAHYGKTFNEIKEELSKESARTDFIGAYYQGEMIGFIQLVYAKDCAIPFGGVSMIAHRDKSPNNALLAKAVEACLSRGAIHLVYGNFDCGTGDGGLTSFKIHNGFRKIMVPRYYVPLTLRGRIILSMNLHHGIRQMIPRRILKIFIDIRRKWYEKRITTKLPPTKQ